MRYLRRSPSANVLVHFTAFFIFIEKQNKSYNISQTYTNTRKLQNTHAEEINLIYKRKARVGEQVTTEYHILTD